MTDDNTTLDAAIEAALVAHKMAPEACNDQMRAFARALIAKLIEGMKEDAAEKYGHPWDKFYNAALTEIRRRAGLEQDT